MGKYKIKPNERGHMPPLKPGEKTISKTFYMPESLMNHVLRQRRPQAYIRSLVEKDIERQKRRNKNGN